VPTYKPHSESSEWWKHDPSDETDEALRGLLTCILFLLKGDEKRDRYDKRYDPRGALKVRGG
jgi:hypothetical protein